MQAKTYDGWMRAGMDWWALGQEASTVAALRLARIAGGGQAGLSEAMLMISEKVAATATVQMSLATGRFGRTPLAATQGTIDYYRGKVAANRRRLGGR